MKDYHLMFGTDGHMRLKRSGAKRSLINFGNRRYGSDFDQVLSAAMTYADDMASLTIHRRDATVIHRFDREFIELWESE